MDPVARSPIISRYFESCTHEGINYYVFVRRIFLRRIHFIGAGHATQCFLSFRIINNFYTYNFCYLVSAYESRLTHEYPRWNPVHAHFPFSYFLIVGKVYNARSGIYFVRADTICSLAAPLFFSHACSKTCLQKLSACLKRNGENGAGEGIHCHTSLCVFPNFLACRITTRLHRDSRHVVIV